MRQRRVRGDEGAAAVELALVLPLLLLLVFGIIEFGRVFNASIEMSGGAREGARAIVVGRSLTEASNIALAAAPTACGGGGCGVTTVNAPCTAGANVTFTIAQPWEIRIPFLPTTTFDLTRTAVMRCEG